MTLTETQKIIINRIKLETPKNSMVDLVTLNWFFGTFKKDLAINLVAELDILIDTLGLVNSYDKGGRGQFFTLSTKGKKVKI